jgi:dienelactone hydrolase
MLARAILRAVKINEATAPYDTMTLKIFYPAWLEDSEVVRETGILPVDTTFAPYPVMIFFAGVNCESYMYFWLAEKLAENGVVVAVMSWLAQNLAGRMSYTPGIALDKVSPQHYGSGFTSSSLPYILQVLHAVNDDSVLANALDMTRIILAGHSAGGTMALQNADKRYLPNVAGSISYCANVLATTALGGFKDGALPRLPHDVPTLIMGATHDGVSTHHNQIYGRPQLSSTDITLAIFDEALPHHRQDSYAVILQGANHYSVCHPLDNSVGRTFLDFEATSDAHDLRQTFFEVTLAFIQQHITHQASQLAHVLANLHLVAHMEHK